MVTNPKPNPNPNSLTDPHQVYTGLRGGAVPVYKGAPEVLQHVPLRSVILADDFADAAALGAHLNALVADEAAYRRHFEWDLQEFAARPTVAQCPWQCRVCEMLLARREAEAGGGRREVGREAGREAGKAPSAASTP